MGCFPFYWPADAGEVFAHCFANFVNSWGMAALCDLEFSDLYPMDDAEMQTSAEHRAVTHSLMGRTYSGMDNVISYAVPSVEIVVAAVS